MKRKVKLKEVALYSKGQQINGDELIEDGSYAYLNGGINPSGKWHSYNVGGKTVTVSEGGNSSGYVNYMEQPFWCGAHCYYFLNVMGEMKYIYYALKSQQDRIMKIRSGACMPNIKKADLGNFEFLFDDDLFVQNQIIKVLDKVSCIISWQQQQLSNLDTLITSRFVEMFGDPIENQHGYPLVSLSEHIDFITSGSRGWAKYCVDDGDEWFITIKNVKNCKITTENMQSIKAPQNAEAQRTRVQEGDLLISITADLGRTGVVSKEIAEHGAYINQHLSCIRLKKGKLLPLYVAYFMESPAGKMQFFAKNQSAVKAGLNFDSIKSLELLMPPLKLQEDFISFIEEIDKLKLAVAERLERIEYLKAALMQKYFG